MTSGAQQFQISDPGGDGNDKVLTQTSGLPLPTLAIVSGPAGAVQLLWRTNNPPFPLQSNTNLAARNCTAATPQPVVIGTNNVVTHSTSDGPHSNRLSHP